MEALFLVCFSQRGKEGAILNKFFTSVLNTPLSEANYVRWLLPPLLPRDPSRLPLGMSALEIDQHNRNPLLILHTFPCLLPHH